MLSIPRHATQSNLTRRSGSCRNGIMETLARLGNARSSLETLRKPQVFRPSSLRALSSSVLTSIRLEMPLCGHVARVKPHVWLVISKLRPLTVRAKPAKAASTVLRGRSKWQTVANVFPGMRAAPEAPSVVCSQSSQSRRKRRGVKA